MGTRREAVILELQDAGFTSGMTRAAAVTALLNRELNALDGSGVRAVGGVRRTEQQVTSLSRTLDQGGASIDRYSGRLKIMLEAIATLGPGLIPIGGVGIQAAGGLANQLASATLAGGTLLAAMQGVADAVKAIDEYQLDPTVANLQKAQEAVGKLGPDAQQFVMAFQDFQPILTGLRDTAAAGWFPGLTDALDDLVRLAPRVERLVAGVSEAGGQLVAQGAAALAGPEWREFWDFLADEMPDTLRDVGSIVGDLTSTFAALWMAFDPLNDSFSSWLVGAAADLNDWAQGLSETQGFADFIDYVQRNGPQVGETLGAIGGAMVEIVQAASPLGGPVLKALEAVADAVSTIADSPIGPKLFTMAAAFVVLNRTLTTTAALLKTMGFLGASAAVRGAIPGAGASSTTSGGILPIGARVTAARASLGQLRRDLGLLSRSYFVAGANTQRVTDAQARAVTTMREYGKVIGVGAAGVGAFAVASGAVGREMGLQNTAMLGLVGAVAGPWGAAIGAGIGLVIDFADSNKQLAQAAADADRAMGDWRVSLTDKLGAVTNEVQTFQTTVDDMSNVTSGFDLVGDVIATNAEALRGAFGDGSLLDKSEANIRANADALSGLSLIVEDVQTRLGDGDGLSFIDPKKWYDSESFIKTFGQNIGEVEQALTDMAPAMDRLNITTDDLFNATSEERLDFGRRIAKEMQYLDTTPGRLEMVGDALDGLGAGFQTAAARGTALGDALSALIDPANNAEAATDAWRLTLKQFTAEEGGLVAAAGFKAKWDEEAIANRALTRTYVDGVKTRLVALVQAGEGEERILGAMRASRREFIESGVAAGFSAEQMRRRATAIGLTPKLVRTVFETVGLADSTIKAEAIKNIYNAMPTKVQSNIALNGVPRTLADADKLIKRFDLAGEDRRAVMRLLDLASPTAREVGEKLDKAAKPREAVIKALPTNTSGAAAAIDQVANKPRTAFINVVVRRTAVNLREQFQDTFGSADGSTVPKDGGPYSDRFPYLLAPGEEVITNRRGQADRHRPLLKAINAGLLADGGTTGPGAALSYMSIGVGGSPVGRAANEAAKGLDNLRKRSERLEKQLSEEEKRRDALVSRMKSYTSGVRDNFRTDPFTASEGSVWSTGTTMDPLGILRGDIRDARQFDKLTDRLRKRGLDGAALLEVDTLAEAQALAAMSNRELRQYEAAYETRQRLTRNLGDANATAVLGGRLEDVRAAIREGNEKLRDIKQAIEREGKRDRDDRKRNSDDHADKTNEGKRHAARRAAQNRRG